MGYLKIHSQFCTEINASLPNKQSAQTRRNINRSFTIIVLILSVNRSYS